MLNPWKKSTPKPSPAETEAALAENKENQGSDTPDPPNPLEAESAAKQETKVGIGEKVRFWQEQDKINKALIPRLVKMNETISLLSGQMSGLSSSIAATEARVMTAFEVRLAEIVTNLDAQAKELSLTVTALEPRLQSLKAEANAGRDQNLKSIRTFSIAALVLSSTVVALEVVKMLLHGSIL